MQQQQPGAAYAVPPPAMSREDALMESFRAVCARYEISEFFARKLKQLEGWEIVLILDDSGSMNTPLQNQGGASAFAKSVTRWDELKQTVGIIVDIGAVMDRDGLDIYFLNRATLSHVTSSAQLDAVFASPAAGLTPITPVLQHVLAAKKAIAVERKLLVVIATDGAPTNVRGEVDTAALKHVLTSERDINRVHVQFVACTDDDSTVAYLNEWDNKIPNVDVVDDYHSERAEVLKAQGTFASTVDAPRPALSARPASHAVACFVLVVCLAVLRQAKTSNLPSEVRIRRKQRAHEARVMRGGCSARLLVHLPLRWAALRAFS